MDKIFKRIAICGLLILLCPIQLFADQKPQPIIASAPIVKAGMEYLQYIFINNIGGIFLISEKGVPHYVYCENYNCSTLEIIFSKHECWFTHSNYCTIVAKNDEIIYPGGIDIFGKKFNYGDRINVFTNPELLSYTPNAAINIDDLPDIYAED